MFFCSNKTDFEFLSMSKQNSKQMKLNILKKIFNHEKELKIGIKNRDKEGLILYVVLSMSHVLCDQEASFNY